MNQEPEHDQSLTDSASAPSFESADQSEGKVREATAEKLAAADAAIDKLLATDSAQFVKDFAQHGGQ